MEKLFLAEYQALLRIERLTRASLAQAPLGVLRISKSHGYVQYYLIADDKKKTYLPKKEMETIRRLAQKSYDQKVLSVTLTEKKHIESLSPQIATLYCAESQSHQPKRPSGKSVSIASPSPVTNASSTSLSHLHCDSKSTAFCLMSTGAERLQRRALPPLTKVKAAFDELPPERKELVVPYVTPDAEYLSAWSQRTPDQNHVLAQPGAYATVKGDLVRSKSEVIIADRLFRAHIPYRYEQPIRLSENGTVVHPDFLLLNPRTRQEIAWEHFGLMDDAAYCSNALGKINAYATAHLFPGMGLIATFESSEQPLNPAVIDAVISPLRYAVAPLGAQPHAL